MRCVLGMGCGVWGFVDNPPMMAVWRGWFLFFGVPAAGVMRVSVLCVYGVYACLSVRDPPQYTSSSPFSMGDSFVTGGRLRPLHVVQTTKC